jgi:hypothetical protein
MTAVGGPIESVNVGGRYFAVAADADAGRQLGGFVNETQENGDGTGRLIKTRKKWMIDGLTLAIDDLLEDQEYLQLKADENGYFPVNFTFASGSVYGGTGQIEDELKFGNAGATVPVTFGGPGKLTAQ